MTGIIDTSQYQYVVFLILAILTAPAIAAAAFSAARNRGGIEARRLAAFLATGLGYLLSNMLELLAPSEGATLFFARFTYLFVTASPVLGLRFALAITGRNKAANSKPLASLLFIIPTTTVILVFTGAGGLVWSSYRFNTALGLPIVYASYGPWFYVHMAYTYLLILASAVIIGLDFAPRHGAFRRQSAWMATGIVIPIAVSALYAFRAIPGLTKDFTPIGIGLSGLAFWLGMRREGLLDLMPVAYSSLVSGLRDPLVVADRKGRIVALNPAAAALDHVQAGIDFIGAIDIDRDVFDVVEVEDRDAMPFEALAGRFRTGDGALVLVLERGQRIDEKIGRRAGTNADDACRPAQFAPHNRRRPGQRPA